MSILSLFTVGDSVWKWMHRLGGPGLILLGLADNAPFVSAPAGSVDVFVILLSAHHHEWWVRLHGDTGGGAVGAHYCFGGAVAASGAAAVGAGAASRSAETSTLPEVTFILRSHVV